LGLKVSISLLIGFSIREEKRKIGGVSDGEREFVSSGRNRGEEERERVREQWKKQRGREERWISLGVVQE
jgi:hypothetical protein